MAFHVRQISTLVAVIVLSIALCAYIIVGAIVNSRKLRQFKGPVVASFSRSWIFWHSINAKVPEAQYAVLKEYGCPARIGPDLLVIDDAEMVRHFNAAGSGWRRSKWYDAMAFDPRLHTVFSTRDEKLHAELKAKEIGAYAGRDIESLEADIDARVLDLLKLIKTRYDGRQLDISKVARFFTIDVLSTIAFGRPFGFMEANEDFWGYNAANIAFFGINELTANHKLWYKLLNTQLMRRLFAPKPTDKTGIGRALGFAHEAVAERFAPNAKVRKDMLGHFVGKGLSQMQCETEAFLQIVAGSDSTTTVLRCTMYLLAGNPMAYGKLRAEIDAAFEAGNFVPGNVVSYAEAQNLPYLNAVLWEGIRMYPPLVGFKSKLAPPHGDTVCGVYFPPGTEVCICDASMCRRPEIFGEDSHVFRPERWLEATPETHKRFTRTVDAIFGTGRFQCLGKHIAMMELHKAYIELIRNFDWMIANPMHGIRQVTHGVHDHSDMFMVARPRDLDV